MCENWVLNDRVILGEIGCVLGSKSEPGCECYVKIGEIMEVIAWLLLWCFCGLIWWMLLCWIWGREDVVVVTMFGVELPC